MSLRGRLLVLGGYAAVVTGAIPVYLFALEIPAGGLRLLTGGAGVALFFVGRAAIRRGRQMTAATADEARRDDSRPPVLYLRSFQDDRHAAKMPPTPRIQTEEEMLAHVLRGVGPVVAIGRPGEPLPELGASRFYVTDDEWQQAVRDLLAEASLVAVRAGATDGLRWELEQIVRLVDPARLVLILPFDGDAYDAFRAKAGMFPKGLPARFTVGARKRGELDGFGIYAVACFDRDWTPRLCPLSRDLRGAVPWYLWARQLTPDTYLRLALRAVLERHGLRVDEPFESRWLRWTAIAKTVFFLALTAILIGATVMTIFMPVSAAAMRGWMTEHGWW